MSRALASGLPRMFTSHAGARGHRFRQQYLALEQRLGPFDPVTRHYAAGAAVLWTQFEADTRALEEAERLRQDGRGRRPSTTAVARLKKRAALTWGSYDAALRRLEELTARRNGHGDPLADVKRAVEAAKRR